MPPGCFVLQVCLVLSVLASAQPEARQLDLMPVPASYQFGPGQLAVDQSFSVALAGHREPLLELAVGRFLHTLSRQTGMTLASGPSVPEKATLTIRNEAPARRCRNWARMNPRRWKSVPPARF